MRPRAVVAAILARTRAVLDGRLAQPRAVLARTFARARVALAAIVVRPRVVPAAVLACLVLSGLTLASAAPISYARQESPEGGDTVPVTPESTPFAAPAEPTSSPEPPVTVAVDGFLAWALLDRTTGDVLQSPNAHRTSSTESMIKAWIVADYLRRTRNPSRRDLADASRAIRDSHNGTTERLYAAGGRDRVVRRMIDICGMRDTYIPSGGTGWWSRTEMSAADAVRLGECIVNGEAAGPEWTDWLLEEMRHVRGSTAAEDQRPAAGFEGGRWGIIDALPDRVAEQVSIKNGWTRIGRDDSWHVNCLAVTEQWVMAVMMRYPARLSLDYGADRCAEVARQLIVDHGLAAPVASPE